MSRCQECRGETEHALNCPNGGENAQEVVDELQARVDELKRENAELHAQAAAIREALDGVAGQWWLHLPTSVHKVINTALASDAGTRVAAVIEAARALRLVRGHWVEYEPVFRDKLMILDARIVALGEL